MLSNPRCDGCFRVGLPTILVKTFMWIDLSYSYGFLKGFYSQPKLGASQTWISTILDVNILNLQSSFSKITIMSNAQWAMDQPMDVNPVSRLWKKLSSNALLCVQLSKYESGKVGYGWDYGIYGRWENLLNFDVSWYVQFERT